MKFTFKGKEKLFGYGAAGLVAAVLVMRFFFFGMFSSLKQLEQKTKIEEARLKEDLAIQGSKDELTNDYNKYLPYLKISQAPQRQIIEDLLKETERIAKESRATVINLSPQATAEQSKEYRKYKADLRLEANMEQVFNFFRGIEQSKFLLKIDRVAIIPKDEEETALKIDMVISIVIVGT